MLIKENNVAILQLNYVFDEDNDLVEQARRFEAVAKVFSRTQLHFPVVLDLTLKNQKTIIINNSVAIEKLMLQAAIQAYRLGFKIRGLLLTLSSLTKELSEWKELEAEFHKQEYNINFTY